MKGKTRKRETFSNFFAAWNKVKSKKNNYDNSKFLSLQALAVSIFSFQNFDSFPFKNLLKLSHLQILPN